MEAATPSARVVEAIARREGVSATELSPPLYDVIDTDALDAVASRAATQGDDAPTISFAYREYDVRVEGAETVEVRRRGASGGAPGSRQVSDRSGEGSE
jgi:hypothetical protein